MVPVPSSLRQGNAYSGYPLSSRSLGLGFGNGAGAGIGRFSTRLVYAGLSFGFRWARERYSGISTTSTPGESALQAPSTHIWNKRATERFDPHSKEDIAFAVLIPILVLLSGLFAGLTLGYMSLDETQLHVLSISGTPKQRRYANKIKPIRQNGHLLLVTLLLANMIVNETLPVIADPVLGGGFQSVVVSTVLIVIFAEIIPQSVFTRHGLYLGAKMATPTQYMIYALGIVSWPVAKLLEFVLGPHHGIIYRRGELKELIAMHSSQSPHGGDLKNDTVTIIGATLDLQEKVVEQAMTPISDVFMLSIDAKLDYELLKTLCNTGHSRVPVYEEVDVVWSGDASNPPPYPIAASQATSGDPNDGAEGSKGGKQGKMTYKAKKIIGILLVKHCVLLDPKDATPLRSLPLNKVPYVPANESLLGILDKFQEGRSHMAIVSRFSVEKAASVKKVVKMGLTQRLRGVVGIGDSSASESESSDESSEDEEDGEKRGRGWKRGGKKRRLGLGRSKGSAGSGSPSQVSGSSVTNVDEDEKCPATTTTTTGAVDADGDEKDAHGHDEPRLFNRKKAKKQRFSDDLESGRAAAPPNLDCRLTGTGTINPTSTSTGTSKSKAMARAASARLGTLEQMMPADAVLGKAQAAEFLAGLDHAVGPLGIITLEDVLEEIIGEEIYDEFDPQGAHGDPVQPQDSPPLPASTGADVVTSHPASALPIKTDLSQTQGADSSTATMTTTTTSDWTSPQAEQAGTGQILSTTKTTIPIPGLPLAFVGLNFLRSRSAPPTPRPVPPPQAPGASVPTAQGVGFRPADEGERERENEGDIGVEGSEKPDTIATESSKTPIPITNTMTATTAPGTGKGSIAMPRPIRAIAMPKPIRAFASRSSSAANLASLPETSVPGATAEVQRGRSTSAAVGSTGTGTGTVGAAAGLGGVTGPTTPGGVVPVVEGLRSVSPAPSVEAVLLDRKRRMAAAARERERTAHGGTASGASTPVAAHPGSHAYLSTVLPRGFTAASTSLPSSASTTPVPTPKPSGHAAGTAPGLGAASSTSSGVPGMGAVVTPKGYKFKSSPLTMGAGTPASITVGSHAFASSGGKGKTVVEEGYDVEGPDTDVGARAGKVGAGAGAQVDNGAAGGDGVEPQGQKQMKGGVEDDAKRTLV